MRTTARISLKGGGTGTGLPADTVRRLTWAFVLLGAAASALRFALRYPIWPDEAFLAINLARRSAAGVLEPLAYHQVAPPAFLLLEWSMVQVLGFSEWVIRLLPFLAALASLVLFRAVALGLARGWPAVLAVGVFSTSYWIVRHGAEAKPYTIDLCVCLLLLWTALRWDRSRRPWRWIAGLAGLCAIAFALSFPAIFVGGATTLFVAARARERRRRAPLVQAALVGACLAGGFALTWALHTSRQSGSELTWMHAYWDRAFPDLTRPVRLLAQCLDWCTGELMPYPIGGRHYASTATLICVTVGAIAAFRHWRLSRLILLAAPFALALIAAFMKRYPFGAPIRCQLYLAPILCLLAGLGLAALLRHLATRGPRPYHVACAVLMAIVVATMVRDVVLPAKTTTDLLLRDVSRGLWRGGDLAGRPNLCLRLDLGATFSPGQDAVQNLLASYLCNHRIYARPDHAAGPVEWIRGVQVINYQVDGVQEERLRRAWIARFEKLHLLEFVASAYVAIPDVDNHGRLKGVDQIEIMRFEPGPARAGGGRPAG